MYILKLLLLLNALSLSRLMDDDETDEDRHPDHERRHQHAYSLAQKVRYLDDYIQAHILGQPHARTPTAFARHNRIHPRTFLDWLADEDDLRNCLENRPTRDGRRRRRRPEGGNLLFHSITLQLCPKRDHFWASAMCAADSPKSDQWLNNSITLMFGVLKMTFHFPGKWEDVENHLRDWFHERRALGFPISAPDLILQATRHYQNWWVQLRQEERERYQATRPHLIPFRASSGWLQNFLRR